MIGQGIGGPVYSPNGTTLIRTKNGISISVSMPTPHACAPPPPGTPPPNDFSEGQGGVYNLAGHAVSGGGSLNMVGHISVGASNFGGPHTLRKPYGAEIHVAIAPHGIVIPGLLPAQFNTPIGNPSFWWVSLFLAP